MDNTKEVEKLLYAALAEIEVKHIDWLKNQPSKRNGKDSQLNDYYGLLQEPLISIIFLDELPLNIKEDCLNQWEKVGLIKDC